MTAKTSSRKCTARTKAVATNATALVGARGRRAVADHGDERFAEVIALIEAARERAYQAVNAELVTHYWELGEYISRKIASAEWGDGVGEELAADFARHYPGIRGYTRPNLFRMRQFYEAYRTNRKVSPLVRLLSWTHHLIILSQAKPVETREFLGLAPDHSEADLHGALLLHRGADLDELEAMTVTEQKRRRHYGHAAELVAACVAYDQTGEATRWAAALQAEYKRFPALRDELDRALGTR